MALDAFEYCTFQVNDELRAICDHACARKDTSIRGSILLLRFFHGYVPSEVARLTQSSRNIVDVQLRSARAEAIASLHEPRLLNREIRNPNSRRSAKPGMQTASGLLTELREKIFATRRGESLDTQQLSKFYKSRKVMPRATLSHLVSCYGCLDKANSLLGLPLLRERNVIDVLGRTTEVESKESYPFRMLIISFITATPFLPFLTSAGTEWFGDPGLTKMS